MVFGGCGEGWRCLVVRLVVLGGGLMAADRLINGGSSSKNTAVGLAMREEGEWKRRNGRLPCLDIFL